MDFTQLALIGVFASVALVAGAVTSMILSRGNVERRRLRQVVSSPSSVLPVLPELLPLASEGPGGTWEDLERLLLHRSRKEMNRLRLRMTRAGIQSPGAPALYTIAEVVLPVVLGGGAYLYAPLSPPLWYILIVAAVAGGFFLPGFWLESRLSKRRREIQNGLPDALDLMVVCIEAGSGLDQAILKTAEEIYFAYPALGDELRILNSEIRAGKTRIEAFKSLAQRTKVDDIRALTAMLVQTDRFGTSIGQALRTHADNSRTRRRQRAEEAAQKIGVKLVFPLVFCFFPAFYVVVLGPAVIMFVRNFQ